MLEQVLLTSKGFESGGVDALQRQNLPSRGGFAEVFGSAINEQEGESQGFLAGLVKKAWSEEGASIGLPVSSLTNADVRLEGGLFGGEELLTEGSTQEVAAIFPLFAFKEGMPSASGTATQLQVDTALTALEPSETLVTGIQSALSAETMSLTGIAQESQKVADMSSQSAKDHAGDIVFNSGEGELPFYETEERTTDWTAPKVENNTVSETDISSSSIMAEHVVPGFEKVSNTQKTSENGTGLEQDLVEEERLENIDLLQSKRRNAGEVSGQSKVAYSYADEEMSPSIKDGSNIEQSKGLRDSLSPEIASTMQSTEKDLQLSHDRRTERQDGENSVPVENAQQWFRTENQEHALLNKNDLPSLEKSEAIQTLASGIEEVNEVASIQDQTVGRSNLMHTGREDTPLVESDGSENASDLDIAAEDKDGLELSEGTGALQAGEDDSAELLEGELNDSAKHSREVMSEEVGGELVENSPQDDMAFAFSFGATEHSVTGQEIKSDTASMRINTSQDGSGNSHQANNRSALGGDSGQSGMNSSGQSGQGQQQSGQQSQGQAAQQQFMQMAQAMAQNVQTVRQQNLQQNIERTAIQNPNVDMTVLASDTETNSDLDMLQSALPTEKRNQLPQGLQSIGLPVNHARWGNSFGQRVVYMANNQIQQAQITLNPEKLGPVQIKLHVDKDQQVHVVMSAQHGATREAIELAMPRLREMMEQAGVDLGSVDVSDQREFAENMNGEDDASKKQGSNPSNAELGMEASNEADVTTHTTDNLVDFYA